MRKIAILAIVLLTVSTNGFSQFQRKFIDTGSVKNQFDYLINKSNRYEDYKVVKIYWLQKLKTNTLRTIDDLNNEISKNKETINAQNKTIENLNAEVSNLKNTIENLNNEKERISLLGIHLKKGTFKTILYLIIMVLAALLALFIFKFNQSNIITKQVKVRLQETEDEFDAHRKRALEREQKVMRKLQDEINKRKDK